MSLFAASVLLVLGASIALLNFYLSFLRPLRFRRRPDEYRHVSGIPLFGSLMCVAAYFLLPGGSPLRAAAIVAALVDTGGIHWLPIAMLWHALFGADESQRE